MNTEPKEMRASVREGYQILLRAVAELHLPKEEKTIADYYVALAEKCMTWAVEVHGEMLRKEFLALESIREKSQFRTQKYQFFMRPVWESDMHVAILCESKLLHQRTTPEKSYHRLSHVWNRKENTILPSGQVVELFQKKAALKTVGFRPDGIYPEADSIVFFRNPRDRESFREIKIPMTDNQPS